MCMFHWNLGYVCTSTGEQIVVFRRISLRSQEIAHEAAHLVDTFTVLERDEHVLISTRVLCTQLFVALQIASFRVTLREGAIQVGA